MHVYFNHLEKPLNIKKKVASTGYHSGDCTNDIIEISRLPEIKQQLSRINPEDLKKELKEYGAWEDDELDDHNLNLQRILWIACANILES